MRQRRWIGSAADPLPLESMRVVLQRAPKGSHDPTGIDLFLQGGQQIGHLSAEVAAEIAPLLDFGRTTLDAAIWSVDEFTAGEGRKLLACTIAMTQFERVPVRRFVRTLALLTAARGTASSAEWTVDRGSSALGWLGQSVNGGAVRDPPRRGPAIPARLAKRFAEPLRCWLPARSHPP